MSTGFSGAIDEILAGRLIAGTVIVIFLLAGVAVLAVPFLLEFVAADVEDFLLLTFLLAPLVDVLVTAFFPAFPFVVFLTTFALETDLGGAFLLTFLTAAFEVFGFLAAFLGNAFLLTRVFGAAFLAFFEALPEAFFPRRLVADLVAVFFRAVMRLSLLLP